MKASDVRRDLLYNIRTCIDQFELKTSYILSVNLLNLWFSKQMFEIYIRTLLNLPNTIVEFTQELKTFKNPLYAYAQFELFEDEF